jgi:hypothetical protein
MNFSTGWAALAALLFAVPAANAQGAPNGAARAPYSIVSDFDGPYAEMPPEAPAPRYGYGPSMLPATEVYTVLRENGFSPLGIPRLRGRVYTIAVIDRRGDDGRLVIDARDGRIVRFLPARGIGPASDQGVTGPYGPQDVLPPPTVSRAAPRPPASIPHVASRTVPVPKPSPLAAKPVPAPAAAAAPAPAQQAAAQQAAVTPPVAAAQPKPEEAQATAQAAAPAPTVAQAPLAPASAASAILPTQEMPKVQGLE